MVISGCHTLCCNSIIQSQKTIGSYPESNLFFHFESPFPKHSKDQTHNRTRQARKTSSWFSKRSPYCPSVGGRCWFRVLLEGPQNDESLDVKIILVGGFNPFENISQIWIISPGRVEKTQCHELLGYRTVALNLGSLGSCLRSIKPPHPHPNAASVMGAKIKFRVRTQKPEIHRCFEDKEIEIPKIWTKIMKNCFFL